MKILFICKYNRFRSKTAEVYFNKINKNKKNIAKSAGIIEVNAPLSPSKRERNIYLKKKFGFVLSPNSVSVSVKSLLWADKIIIVADDIPTKIFNSKKWEAKVGVWKIEDENGYNKRNINKIVNFIIKKVNTLVKKLDGKNENI